MKIIEMLKFTQSLRPNLYSKCAIKEDFYGSGYIYTNSIPNVRSCGVM